MILLHLWDDFLSWFLTLYGIDKGSRPLLLSDDKICYVRESVSWDYENLVTDKIAAILTKLRIVIRIDRLFGIRVIHCLICIFRWCGQRCCLFFSIFDTHRNCWRITRSYHHFITKFNAILQILNFQNRPKKFLDQFFRIVYCAAQAFMLSDLPNNTPTPPHLGSYTDGRNYIGFRIIPK